MDTDTMRAFDIALKAHKNQKDKGGHDYIGHPIRMFLDLTDKNEKIVALLHDVVEDTYINLEDIAHYFDEDIVKAVDALTKKEDEPYKDYIKRVKDNPLAVKVKIADLNDNLSEHREFPNSKGLKTRYKKSLKFLENKLLEG